MQLITTSAIGILGAIAFVLMCGEPANEETWFETFLITKGIALLLGYITYRLFAYWESKGLLPDLDDEEKL